MSPSQKPTNTTNELAKERNRAAAERTLTSWIQNCLSLIGFGIAFDRIFNALNESISQHNPRIAMQLTHIIGLSAIALGIFLLILAMIGYLIKVKSLEQQEYSHKSTYIVNLSVFVVSVILFGLVTLVAVFTLTPSQ
ncbi:MAG: DUF202 domain-containing protein [Pelatocladus maniniholoensis HA4357-MV3]|jgi:putative membrane protein|uniref:DUF202 domain-containing protein n=1 Tax=Pelatocladus maniniholoensis HA4357-MV3 TaxID=1117104 RepID=A0A9E3H8E0_9NOST|nr:DUF202 domain-containing protein [Pelatocladus maniniholoensis HA4357-MV3]BAZ65602.1 hypothetical protein NIES4106_03410 [Fischerella sp. NIES-4106]